MVIKYFKTEAGGFYGVDEQVKNGLKGTEISEREFLALEAEAKEKEEKLKTEIAETNLKRQEERLKLKESAKEKLKALGLTEEEISAF